VIYLVENQKRTESMKVIQFFLPEIGHPLEIPVATSKVSAGFPSPVDDGMDATLDLNRELVKNPPATYFVRVAGDSMLEAGIHDGDILVVDRSLPPSEGRVVIAALNGDLLVKRLLRKGGMLWLAPENDKFPPIQVREEEDLIIWGVVTRVIHSL